MSKLRELMVDESAIATTTCISAGSITGLMCLWGAASIGLTCLLGGVYTWFMCLLACLSPCLAPLALLGGGGGGTVIHLPADVYY
jgi:hypothetical protein